MSKTFKISAKEFEEKVNQILNNKNINATKVFDDIDLWYAIHLLDENSINKIFFEILTKLSEIYANDYVKQPAKLLVQSTNTNKDPHSFIEADTEKNTIILNRYLFNDCNVITGFIMVNIGMPHENTHINDRLTVKYQKAKNPIIKNLQKIVNLKTSFKTFSMQKPPKESPLINKEENELEALIIELAIKEKIKGEYEKYKLKERESISRNIDKDNLKYEISKAKLNASETYHKHFKYLMPTELRARESEYPIWKQILTKINQHPDLIIRYKMLNEIKNHINKFYKNWSNEIKKDCLVDEYEKIVQKALCQYMTEDNAKMISKQYIQYTKEKFQLVYYKQADELINDINNAILEIQNKAYDISFNIPSDLQKAINEIIDVEDKQLLNDFRKTSIKNTLEQIKNIASNCDINFLSIIYYQNIAENQSEAQFATQQLKKLYYLAKDAEEQYQSDKESTEYQSALSIQNIISSIAKDILTKEDIVKLLIYGVDKEFLELSKFAQLEKEDFDVDKILAEFEQSYERYSVANETLFSIYNQDNYSINNFEPNGR